MLLLAAAVVAIIFSTEPSAERAGAVKQTAMLVQVAGVERGTFRPLIVVTGTVTPERDIVLRPRVGGQVVERAPAFTPGGFVEASETLLKLDPADYENTLRQRRTELRQAASELKLELGRQDVARHEYEVLGERLPLGETALVLREPQLEAAQVRVEAAQVAVDQAELELRRATLRAPFAAQVLSREVDIGSQVSPGDALARLVGVETYWVVVAVPLPLRRWLGFAEGEADEPGSEVTIHNRSAWPEGVYRTGHVQRVIGALDEQTRLARVIVSVPDPLALLPDAPRGAPALMVGEFVEARIRGREIEDVVRLDRDYLRKDDTVWVMQEGQLRIAAVEVVLEDADYAYVSAGLGAQDRVVTTNLATVVEGAPLRVGRAGEGE